MLEVEVRNFQSIRHATIQIQGFTALVGRSNIGKSAIVRAVKAALTGAPSTSFVRHDPNCVRRTKSSKTCKCFCSVHITAEGFDLLWEKGDAINRYTFNGQVYDKAERGTPDFLQPVYAPIKVGDDKELLQVSDQFDPIFLLNQTGGVIADVLSDVANLDRVNIAIRLAEKDRKEAASTRKVREQDVVDLTQRLVLFDGLDDALAAVRDVEDRQTELETAEKSLTCLEGFLERCGALGSSIKLLEGVLKVEAPAPEPLAELLGRLSLVSRLYDRLVERVASIRELQGIEAIKAPDDAQLRHLADEFDALDGWVGRLRVFKVWMDKVKVLEAVRPLTPEGIQKAWLACEALGSLTSRYEGLSEQVGDLQGRWKALEVEGEALQAEWEALGVCPTCTQPVHGDHHGLGNSSSLV